MSILKKNINWLLFLEDPGAVIFAYKIIEKLPEFGINLIVIATGNAISQLEKKNIFIIKHQTGINPHQYFDKYKIKVLLTGTSENVDSFSFMLIDLARKKMIPVIALVDGAGSYNERFKGKTNDSLFWSPNWLVVPDKTTANLYTNLGFDSSRIKLLRHPHYDYILSLKKKWSSGDYEAQRKKWIPKAGNKKVITFISEISDGLNPELYKRSDNYTLMGNSSHNGRTEIVLDEILLSLNQIDPKPYLILRLHPKQKSDDLNQYLNLFDFVSKDEDSLEIVNISDLVIGMTSSLLSEAFYLGKSVLSVIPDPIEKVYLGDLAELIPCAYTRDLVEYNIKNALINKVPHTETLTDSENSINNLINFFKFNLFSN
jgi:hypothetical protein